MKAILSGLLFITAGFAQSPVRLSFDVASVKPNTDVEGHTHVGQHGGNLEMTNVTLKQAITLAYDVMDAQVSGPPWLETDRYDIIAKAPADETDESQRQRFQTLLADRFALTLHRESREGSVYEPSVAKGGPKLTKDDSGTPGDNLSSRRGHLTAQRSSMAQLVDFLGSARAALDRPVIDKTGINGVYNFTLAWTPGDVAAARNPTEESRTSLRPAETPRDRPPSLFVALQEQLGLKLDARKAQVEVLVIDHADKVPTGN